jgi:hypothetical protein
MAELSHSGEAAGGWASRMAPNGGAGLGWAGTGRTVRRLIEGPIGELRRAASLDCNVVSVLERRAVEDSAEYIAAAMPQALAVHSREKLWDFCDPKRGQRGPVARVWRIQRLFNKLPGAQDPRKVYGFDSFRGLDEDWTGVGHVKGTFDLSGRLPRVRPNVTLLAGWFRETLPGFSRREPRAHFAAASRLRHLRRYCRSAGTCQGASDITERRHPRRLPRLLGFSTGPAKGVGRIRRRRRACVSLYGVQPEGGRYPRPSADEGFACAHRRRMRFRTNQTLDVQHLANENGGPGRTRTCNQTVMSGRL